MKKSIPFLLLLSGCAAPDRDYSNTPTSELCLAYMTKPSYNIWHEARARELDRRGVNCGDPSSVAAARSRADQTYGSFIQQAVNPPPASGYQQGTHVYIIDGKHKTCTTTGTHTICN